MHITEACTHPTPRCNNTPQKEEQQVSYKHLTTHVNYGQHSPQCSLRCLLPSPAAAAPPLAVPPEMHDAKPSYHPTPRYNKTQERRAAGQFFTTVTHMHSADSTHPSLSLNACPLLQQQPHHLSVSLIRCPMQSRQRLLLTHATIPPRRRSAGQLPPP
jgi:hypothetical protein